MSGPRPRRTCPREVGYPLAGARYGFRVGGAISDLADVSMFDGRRVVARDLPREFDPFTRRFCAIATEPDGTLLVAEYEQTNGTWTDYKIPRYQFEVKRLTAEGRVLGSILSGEFRSSDLPEAHDCLASGPTGTWMALKHTVYGPAGGVTISGFSDVRSIAADQAGNAYVRGGERPGDATAGILTWLQFFRTAERLEPANIQFVTPFGADPRTSSASEALPRIAQRQRWRGRATSGAMTVPRRGKPAGRGSPGERSRRERGEQQEQQQ